MKPHRLDEFSNPAWYRAPRESRDPVNYACWMQGRKPSKADGAWLNCVGLLVLLGPLLASVIDYVFGVLQ